MSKTRNLLWVMEDKSGKVSGKSGGEFVVHSTGDVVDGVAEVVQGHGGLVEYEGVVYVLSDCFTHCHLPISFHLGRDFRVVLTTSHSNIIKIKWFKLLTIMCLIYAVVNNYIGLL